MGLLDNYTGIGMSPRPTHEHQTILRNIIVGLTNDGISALSENCVDKKNLNSEAPDVCIYENEDDRYPVSIIEVTTHKERNEIIAKVKELLNNYKNVKEAFVYNYEKDIWLAFGEIEDENESSYSDFFDVDFEDYL